MRDRAILSLQASFLEANDVRFLDQRLAHLRDDYLFSPWIEVGAVGQYENNIVHLLDARFVAGAGVSWVAVQSSRFGLWGSVGTPRSHRRAARLGIPAAPRGPARRRERPIASGPPANSSQASARGGPSRVGRGSQAPGQSIATSSPPNTRIHTASE